MRLCRDRDCERYGVQLKDSEFGRNAVYADFKHIYCRRCCQRRTNEQRESLVVLAQRTKVKLPSHFLNSEHST
jgi:hypothetical protein